MMRTHMYGWVFKPNLVWTSDLLAKLRADLLKQNTGLAVTTVFQMKKDMIQIWNPAIVGEDSPSVLLQIFKTMPAYLTLVYLHPSEPGNLIVYDQSLFTTLVRGITAAGYRWSLDAQVALMED